MAWYHRWFINFGSEVNECVKSVPAEGKEAGLGWLFLSYSSRMEWNGWAASTGFA